tara:strand:+ start:441 stop:545 length:105 start_codon:yes stop_codon:yes gene_type:complete
MDISMAERIAEALEAIVKELKIMNEEMVRVQESI